MIYFKKLTETPSNYYPLDTNLINIKEYFNEGKDMQNFVFAFVFDYESFYELLHKKTSFQAKLANPKEYGDLFDVLVITKDEEVIVENFIKEACRNIRGTLDGFARSVLDNFLYRQSITKNIPVQYLDNLVINGGAEGTTDWIDTDEDGLADGFTADTSLYQVWDGAELGTTPPYQIIAPDEGTNGDLSLCEVEAGKTYQVKFTYAGSRILLGRGVLDNPIEIPDHDYPGRSETINITPDSDGTLVIGFKDDSYDELDNPGLSIDEVYVQECINTEVLTDKIVFYIEPVNNKKFYQTINLVDPQILEVMASDVIKQWFSEIAYYEGLQKEMIRYDEQNSDFRANIFQIQSVKRSGIW